MKTYDVSIKEDPPMSGTFRAVCEQDGLPVASISKSRDPEHDICLLMYRAGYEEGPVQFWRGTMKSLHFKSLRWGASHTGSGAKRNPDK